MCDLNALGDIKLSQELGPPYYPGGGVVLPQATQCGLSSQYAAILTDNRVKPDVNFIAMQMNCQQRLYVYWPGTDFAIRTVTI